MSKQIKRPLSYLEDTHLNKGTKEFLKMLNTAGISFEALPIDEARNAFINAQEVEGVDVSGIEESEKIVEVDGYTIKLTIVRPEGVKGTLPAFIYLHGGGWTLGNYSTHRRLVRDLVVTSGYASVFINFSLSPEVRFPYAVEEIYAATKWVAAHANEINVDGKKLAIAGNNVGGNMAIATCLKAKESKDFDIKAQILLCPVTDASVEHKSFKLYGEERLLTTAMLKWMGWNYVSKPDDIKSIYLSPLGASIDQLRGLPPTFIAVAENDVVRDQGEAFGRRLEEADVEVTCVRFNNVIHDWAMINAYAQLPETRSLIILSSGMLKDHLK